MGKTPRSHDPGPVVERTDREDPRRTISRRDFLRVSGTVTATAAMTVAGCQAPVEHIVPFSDRPEGLRSLGKPLFYATAIDGAPALVRTREGRPILITPNPAHPAGGSLTVRTHAALLDLYDADRTQRPLSVRRSAGSPVRTSVNAVNEAIVRALEGHGGEAVLLTRPVSGAATRAALDAFSAATGARVVTYEPYEADTAAAAWQRCFGAGGPPRPLLAKADLIVGFGADFIDEPASGLERDFALRRAPEAEGGISRFVAFEGRLSLTGANADQRVRVRDSRLAHVALALAHELIVAQRVGDLASDGTVQARLAPFAADKVAAQTGVGADTLRALAKDLAEKPGRSAVLAGATVSASRWGVVLQTAVHLINVTLGNYGRTFDLAAAATPANGGLAALAALAEDLRAGRVKTLLVAGPNPVYDAPAAFGFGEAMGKAKLVVSLNERLDETSREADYLLPASHALESWGDVAYPGNVHTVQQPVIRPLYTTFGLLDFLAVWAVGVGAGGPLTAAWQASRPSGEPAVVPPVAPTVTSPAYHFVRAYWGRELLKATPGTPVFESAWEDVLRAGFWQGPAPTSVRPVFRSAALENLEGELPALPGGLELQLFPHFAHGDGRVGNNGWLHELPDPISRVTWGGWLAMAPRRFDEMGLKNGDLLDVKLGDATATLPAYRQAGMAYDQLAAPLGLGRSAAGLVGNDVGTNLFPLLPVAGGRTQRAGLAVSITVQGGHEDLAIPQGSEVIERQSRPVVPVATLSEYERDASAGTEQPPSGPPVWPEHRYEKQRWAMAIDLSKCNGCGKCSLACQAENNIPVVGRQGVMEGREMSWIRIDRYYDAPAREAGWDDSVWDGPLEVVEEPVTLFEPMLCQHCGNAPCETVCPFVATMHSEDGLNQQIYNRCVGTRYCANNCPFKVRRFNWFEYSTEQTNPLFALLVPSLYRHAELNVRGRMQMKNNPEVTVRARGVMEKCSFCVQRIREARAQAIREGRPGELREGDVVPACMEACPTGAIVFGNVNDPASQVSARKASPRAMRLLEATGVEPSISYLTKVRNDNG